MDENIQITDGLITENINLKKENQDQTRRD